MPTSSLRKIKQKLSEAKAERNILIRDLKKAKTNLISLEAKYEDLVLTKSLIQKAVTVTQESLRIKISDITTKALATVFGNTEEPYAFVVDFVERRNSIECDLYFFRNNRKFIPLDSSGFGAADIASFTLRLSTCILQKSVPFLLADEPFRHLSKDLQPAIAEILKQLKEKLKMQFIIVSHEDELISCADKTYETLRLENETQLIER